MSPKKKEKYVAVPDDYLAAIETGLGPEAAAAKAGVSLEDLDALRELPETKRAEGDALGKIEGVLFKAALQGKITAMIFWLCNRDPERWKNVASIGRGGEGGDENALERAIRDLQE